MNTNQAIFTTLATFVEGIDYSVNEILGVPVAILSSGANKLFLDKDTVSSFLEFLMEEFTWNRHIQPDDAILGMLELITMFKEVQMAMANDPRWKTAITYNFKDGTSATDQTYIDEIEELDDLIEGGPDWRDTTSIDIRLEYQL